MKHVFWVIENKLAGRPGPDLEPWDIGELFDAGIRAVLSVNPGISVARDELNQRGISYRCVSLTSDAPPLPGDVDICLDRLPEALSFVESQIGNNRPALVHCRSGKDRTGLFMAYYLLKKHDLSPDEAIDKVKRCRPIALSADGWNDFALNVLRSC